MTIPGFDPLDFHASHLDAILTLLAGVRIHINRCSYRQVRHLREDGKIEHLTMAAGRA